MYRFASAAVAASLLLSCKKDAGDSLAPVISVSSPADLPVFTAGQTITISAAITDLQEVHAVHLYVRNKATSTELLHFEEHTNQSKYNLVKTFTAQAGVTYKIEIVANDQAENESRVELEVSGK